MKSLHVQAAVLVLNLYKLERCGRYEEAFYELREIWEDYKVFPNVSGIDEKNAAEIILRCGSLLGFLGNTKLLPNAQEYSKNLLTDARDRFIILQNIEKITECENYLALAYWRKGEHKEALDFVDQAIFNETSKTSLSKIYAHLTKSLIFLSLGKDQEVVNYLKNLEKHFRRFGDALMNGSFYCNLAIAQRNLGDTVNALRNLELARYFHQRSQHKIYLGTVENNLSQIYKDQKRFVKAHEVVDSATKTFREINDITREAFSYDTKAQIYFADKKYAESVSTIEKAIEVLKNSENSSYLSETYMTKAKSLIYLEDFTAATFALFEAVNIARTNLGEAEAEKLVNEFEETLKQKNAIKANAIIENELETGKIELLLPSEIAHFTDFQGVWINNAHLESIGIYQGSLAIVVNDEVKRGDLIAITEIETDETLCGFYDADFGIVCLEGINAEPILFVENDIKIIGKIVGVCNSGKNPDGKMTVEAIDFERF